MGGGNNQLPVKTDEAYITKQLVSQLTSIEAIEKELEGGE